eukprot:193201-Alexandrium_andersonii.AAC.1
MLEDEEGALKEARALILNHIPPPTVVGASAGQVVRRFSKVLHSLYLEVGSHRLLADILRSCSFWLADYGTERQFPLLEPFPVRKLLPWAVE